VGYAKEGEIRSCHSEATVTGTDNVGGLVGRNQYSHVEACHSAGAVAGESSVGGLAGTSAGTITACRASGPVTGKSYVGGFAGVLSGTVSHCYATGATEGESSVGGFFGRPVGGHVMFCYATGPVSGNEQVAGFAPQGSVYLCYWDVETSQIAGAGVGRGKTTDQMKKASTFAGWGYESRWSIADGIDYPRLTWEATDAEILVDRSRTYGGGTGDPDDPYLVRSAEHLVSIARYREDFDKHFRMVNDIDVATTHAEDVMPIGYVPEGFTGSFEGSGYAISNFTWIGERQGRVGLFGIVSSTGSVRDLHLVDARIVGWHSVGALVGSNSGTVSNCSVTGTVDGEGNVGGLAGANAGRIEACTVDAQVTGHTAVGGLVGLNLQQVRKCATKSRVTGRSSVGGLVGCNEKEILASCAAAHVVGTENVGGLVGYTGRASFWTICPAPPPSFVPGLSDSRITACYCTGSVSGQEAVGGLVGHNSGVVMGCYAACPILYTYTPARAGRSATVDISGGGSWE